MLNLDLNYTLIVVLFVVGPCILNGVVNAMRKSR